MLEEPKGYKSWRATVPFTDAEIADAQEQIAVRYETDGNEYMAKLHRFRASQNRLGYVRSKDVKAVLGQLIKTCAICGKKALYRTGVEGRCSTHKLIKAAPVVARFKRSEDLHNMLRGDEAIAWRVEQAHRRLKEVENNWRP